MKDLISILKICKKKDNFHARFSAKLRTYDYFIINRQGQLAVNQNKAWHVKKKLNLKILRAGAKLFEGTHDFSTYRAASCSAKSPVKKISMIKIKKKNDTIRIRLSSKSFLQNQVRSMVGCLKYLSEGKWILKSSPMYLKKQRSLCAPPAPACGLYLQDIKY